MSNIKKSILLMILNFFSFNIYAASAVYYSPKLGTSYRKIKAPSLDEAINKAKIGCEKEADDCRLLGSSKQGGYGAIASRDYQGFTLSLAEPSKKNALKNALASCNKSYGGCQITAVWYDTVIFPKEVLEREAAEEAKIQAMNRCYGYAGGYRDCGSQYDAQGQHYLTGKYIGQQ